ncbi:hypothetical protein [Methylophilus sp.]|uniref:hypothetical protein n=1 Tax=Methylophilus sp. TaxID=29541 RepID=UPI0040354E5F
MAKAHSSGQVHTLAHPADDTSPAAPNPPEPTPSERGRPVLSAMLLLLAIGAISVLVPAVILSLMLLLLESA